MGRPSGAWRVRLARNRVLSSGMSDQLLIIFTEGKKVEAEKRRSRKEMKKRKKALQPNHLSIKLTTTRAPRKLALIHRLYPIHVIQNGTTLDPERVFQIFRVNGAQYRSILIRSRSRRRRRSPGREDGRDEGERYPDRTWVAKHGSESKGSANRG